MQWLDDLLPRLARRDDLQWLPREEARERGRTLQEKYAGENYSLGTIWSQDLWNMCQTRTHGLLQAAVCPATPTRTKGPIHGALLLHPDRPYRMWLTPSAELPPAFWIPVEARDEALDAALAVIYPARRVARADLTHRARGLLGDVRIVQVPDPYSGEMAAATPAALARHFAMSPCTDGIWWGRAFDDDPWPDADATQSVEQIAARMRDISRQREGDVGSMTFRTHFSRSQVTLEMHAHGSYVWDIAYRPSPFPQVVEQLNQWLGLDIPVDLPTDVAAMVHGFYFTDKRKYEEMQRDAADNLEIASRLHPAIALRCTDPDAQDFLRGYLSHPSLLVRANAAELAVVYGWPSLLQEALSSEPDADLRASWAEILVEGIPPQRFNDQGEPAEWEELLRNDALLQEPLEED